MKAIITYRTEDDIECGIFPRAISYDIENRTAIVKTLDGAEVLEVEEVIDFIPLTVSGKTYAERKVDLEGKAIEWSYAGGVACWSYGELADIQGFFEANGKRYGLLREFHENGIC